MRKKRRKPTQSVFSLVTAILVVIVVAIAFVFVNSLSVEYYENTSPQQFHSTSTAASSDMATTTPTGFPYIQIVESCGPYYNVDACVNMRSGPGTEHPSILKLRKGVVLKVATTTINDKGEMWYKIDPGQNIRHPDRITSDWYVSAEAAQLIYNEGEKGLEDEATTTKRILVSVTKQMLYAFDGGTLYAEHPISTGHDLTPTQRGVFYVYWKTPSRYMQGPIEGATDDVYDLPGVPWNLYFTYDGAVIHGAYWHNNFGRQWSHGCVNLPPEIAQKVYEWAELGTEVIITE